MWHEISPSSLWFMLFVLIYALYILRKPYSCSKVEKAADATSRYSYKFQQYPFGEFHIFEINADSQEEADRLAEERMTELFESGRTVMKTFHRA